MTHTLSHTDAEIVSLVIDSEAIETTSDHPFYTDDGMWIEVAALEPGDQIYSLDGDYGTVEMVTIVAQPQAMYNLTVDEAHTFFVGDGAWLVHNICRISPNPVPEGSLLHIRAMRLRQELNLDTLTNSRGDLVYARKNIAFLDFAVNGMYVDMSDQVPVFRTGSVYTLSGRNRGLSGIPNFQGVAHIEHAQFRRFQTLAPGMHLESIDRSVDTEAKLLEWFSGLLSKDSKGIGILYTLNQPCKSCGGPNRFHKLGVIGQFADRHPQVDLYVLWTVPRRG